MMDDLRRRCAWAAARVRAARAAVDRTPGWADDPPVHAALTTRLDGILGCLDRVLRRYPPLWTLPADRITPVDPTPAAVRGTLVGALFHLQAVHDTLQDTGTPDADLEAAVEALRALPRLIDDIAAAPQFPV